jgi:hypothetical protein
MVDFFQNDVWPLILFLWPYIKIPVYFVVIIVPLLIIMAYFTYWERKFIGWMQYRRGPNVVGPLGLLQPFADGMKLFLKETIIPSGANPIIFLLAPVITFTLAMVAWVVIPFDEGWVVADINVGILYLFAISSLGVYGIVMAGWSSNSKYAFLGGAAVGGADDILRSVDGLRDRHGIAGGRLAEPVGHRDCPGRWLLELACFRQRTAVAADGSGVPGIHPGRDQPYALRSAGSRG